VIHPHLCPVVRTTPGQDKNIPSDVRVANQRQAARRVCLQSARRLGLSFSELPQDEEGVPQPVDGWHWSISHTRGLVGGIVYPSPVGIDVERVQRRRKELVRAAMSPAELDLLGGLRWSHFTRIWSAKEAVLKKAGCGIAELSRCLLVAVPTPTAMVLSHRDRMHYVFQCFEKEHFVSVCADGADDAEMHWDRGEGTVGSETGSGGFID
jgi:phosphopantetheinyl transferase